jgi:hypothetical protein
VSRAARRRGTGGAPAAGLLCRCAAPARRRGRCRRCCWRRAAGRAAPQAGCAARPAPAPHLPAARPRPPAPQADQAPGRRRGLRALLAGRGGRQGGDAHLLCG